MTGENQQVKKKPLGYIVKGKPIFESRGDSDLEKICMCFYLCHRYASFHLH